MSFLSYRFYNEIFYNNFTDKTDDNIDISKSGSKKKKKLLSESHTDQGNKVHLHAIRTPLKTCLNIK